MNLFDLKNEVAVVIGATGALGGAMADGLAAAGANVAVVGRKTERGEERVSIIRKSGGAATFFSADAMKPESLRAAHEQITKSLGAPTILVNAAGGKRPESDAHPGNKNSKTSAGELGRCVRFELVGGVVLPCQESARRW